MVNTKIIGPDGNAPLVTKFGELVVAPIQYSTATHVPLVTINTGFVILKPIMGKRIVITGAVLSGKKSVGNTPAAVDVYTSSTGEGTTSIDDIFPLDVAKSSTTPIIPLNIIIGSGVWVMAKTDLAVVDVTLLHYYLP